MAITYRIYEEEDGNGLKKFLVYCEEVPGHGWYAYDEANHQNHFESLELAERYIRSKQIKRRLVKEIND